MRMHLAEVRRFASESSSISERVVLMFGSSLFAGLTQEECGQIALFGKLRKFAQDELLFIQGQPIHNLMLIRSGSVKLSQLSSTGNEVILWMTGEREPLTIFGDPTGQAATHSCSARAMEPCTVLSWDYARHRTMLEQYPRIAANINHILSGRLEELQERFREVATERVAKRLALALLRLMRQVGRPHHSGTQVSLSREEMAQMIGTTQFTTSRILSKWSEGGVLMARREGVVVHDARNLQIQAELD